jgi:GrpB-like predicted nucleotidyltransferase (UPF0157 family)
MADPVIVVEYDPAWAEWFLFLQRRIAGALGNLAGAIEHVGSTGVPGLPAKPIIDIDVLLAMETHFEAVTSRLAELGYVHQGNLGIPGREAFAAPVPDVPHHLYVCPPQSRAFQEHLAFRDHLRTHPGDAKAYADLKKSLALQFRDDRSAYSSGKSAFVGAIIHRALSTPAGRVLESSILPLVYTHPSAS